MEVSEAKISIISFICINKFCRASEASSTKLNATCIADLYFRMKNGEDVLQSLTSENNFVVWPCF